jgi:hypothetical protein
MGVYFFDVLNGERDTDDEGIELADEHVARAEAINFASA